jgi:hypothetical protein
MTKESKKKAASKNEGSTEPKKAAKAKTVVTPEVAVVVAAPVVAEAPVKESSKKAASKKDTSKKASKSTLTTIAAKIDIGFGNALYLRGEGAGLSWDKGTALESTGCDEWTWTSSAVSAPVEFKLLINDEIWSQGANAVVEPGQKIEVIPFF